MSPTSLITPPGTPGGLRSTRTENIFSRDTSCRTIDVSMNRQRERGGSSPAAARLTSQRHAKAFFADRIMTQANVEGIHLPGDPLALVAARAGRPRTRGFGGCACEPGGIQCWYVN